MTCNTDLNIKDVTVYSYSGEGFIYMPIYLAGSESIFPLLRRPMYSTRTIGILTNK